MSSRKQHGFLKKGVILLSGGIDSVTTLYFARKNGYKLIALIFDYSQRHKKEIRQAEKIAKINKVGYYRLKIDLAWTKSSLTRRSIEVPSGRDLNGKEIPSTYVSARNVIFLSYAFSLADSWGAKKIFIGAHTQDYSGYPDCRPEFLKSFELAVNLGIKQKGIRIVAPLINKDKKGIIKMGTALRVPFELTWSCYQDGKLPCLNCDSCRFRIRAFESLGMKDPLLRRR